MITWLEFNLQVNSLNSIYEKIYNCRVVKPYYETNKGFYNEKFFLDKRLWQKQYHIDDRNYTDSVFIKWHTYYLSHKDEFMYVSVDTGSEIKDIAGPYQRLENTPLKFALWRWPYWQIKDSFTISGTPELSDVAITDLPEDNEINFYDGWYIKIAYSWDQVAVWDYITFEDGILKWGSNEIEWVDDNHLYIIGTNSRGSLPLNWNNVVITSWQSFWTTLCVWANDGLHVLILDEQAQPHDIKVFNGPVTDVVNFSWGIFILSDGKVFYSRNTFDDNTQFYPLDRFRLDGWYKLINSGKYLIGMSDKNENSIYTQSTWIDGVSSYISYPLNYTAELYSKYSYIFEDSSLLILQDDKQLMQVNIVSTDNLSFDFVTKNITLNSRWLFEDLDGWEVFVNADDKVMHFLWTNDWKTVDVEFDKQYQHWLLHTYNKKIYKIWEWKHLYGGWVSKIEWYTDLWEEYEQEINFQVTGQYELIRPNIIRTIFWLHPEITSAKKQWDDDDRLRLALSMEREIGHQLKKEVLPYDNYLFDNHVDTSHLQIWHKNIARYTGNVVSIQNNIFKLWRFWRFSFHGINRFVYGWSYIVADKTKPYINEPLQSN